MSWKKTISPTDLPEGGGSRITLGSDSIALFLVGNQVLAIGDRCSHAEASLSEGTVVGSEVECPLHGARFDLETGRPLSLPATRPVATYPAKVEGGYVYVEVEEQ